MKKIILSGGGTGGHIYPAVAVAEALKRRFGGDVELLFVGAEGKMEMEKVPALGYRIVGLPIAGLQRRMDWHNLAVPLKVLRSIRMAKKTIRDFGADAVVGFGGYASAPVLWAAQRLGVPTVIQEQNSYAGLTNKILARRAQRICVAYEGMDRFFAPGKITMTGNPLRGRFSKEGADRGEALAYYGFRAELPVVLVARDAVAQRDDEGVDTLARGRRRSGAGDLADGEILRARDAGFSGGAPDGEYLAGRFHRPHGLRLCGGRPRRVAQRRRNGLVARPVLFVPSPNVAEDHQTKNARALEAKGAAVVVPDAEARTRAMARAMELLANGEALRRMSENLEKLARPDAAERIVDEIEKVMK